ncbi:hypothetical protein P0082_09940 [Candidatus Haliotispira prima]|uniref:Uncharacterized protein n=1 Tax=Candidatus Haliotispira prima TaxID=3034016 RepID=A0ABY8MFL9_9SPIO|nr:hypothetical protein P0082_09940 [Candidatus Haliotispira prima]
MRNPDRSAWDVVLPYQEEFSVNQIAILQKELNLLGDHLLGQQDFTKLGTADAKEYLFLLDKMVEMGLITDTVPANRLFVF